MGLPGEAPSPSLCSPLSLSHPSPNLHPLCSLASKFTECFPLTHWIQTKEVPPSLGRSKVSSACFQKGGSPVSLLVFLVPPPIATGLGLGPMCVGGSFSGLWQVRRWNPGDGIVPLGSAPTWQSRASQIHVAKGSLSLCLQAPCPSHPLPPMCQSCPGKGGRTLVVLIKICCRGNEAH